MDSVTRYWPLSFRAAAAVDGSRSIGGLAVPYDQDSRGTLKDPARYARATSERIMPGAFSDVIEEVRAQTRDIVLLVDHDLTRLLARTRSGSLRFTDSADGLRFSATLPDTTEGRDVYELAKRGDLGGVSMGFNLAGSDYDTDSQGRRAIRSVDLHEVSIISAFPAYETSVEARSRGLGTPWRDEVDAWLMKV